MLPMPTETHLIALTRQRWALEDIPWGSIQPEAAVNEEELFYLITTASFIKAATRLNLYVLVRRFSTDREISDWLEQHWQQDELRHARVLRRYVQTLWPEFDWDSAYEYFIKEFVAASRAEILEPEKRLELLSCCIVEMVTTSYYAALSSLASEPVFKLLAQHISKDEVRHYKRFFRYAKQYKFEDNANTSQVLRMIWQHLELLNGSNNIMAMKHVYGACHPSEQICERLYRKLQKRCRRMLANYFPCQVGARLVLKALNMGPRTQRMVSPVLSVLMQRFVA
jgi:hypothetical protein